MKLFYAPGACSLSPHIVACEAGIDLEMCKVDLQEHKTESGADYREINPKGCVPALQLEGGEILTEGPAIVQFIAEQKPDANLAPEYGSLAHYRLLEWLNYIAAEVHKAFVPLFWDGSDEEKAQAKKTIASRFDFIEERLQHDYLMGDDFTVADAYLFTIASWLDKQNIDTSGWPRLQAFQQRMQERPAVQKAMREEGLLQE
ncbi:glutathione transferase GstA [Microbulbifer marinus]|uniref:Glutathione S-transferase n=1 Tax=Microbulbifer marinus TaxID=658218 RepID=A0A1H3Z1Z6_9GAMM|nr:glutathione transferase GstA [Microbulbifer marinus]SEA17354.1 glutathione S-transferase [Microbulbifer marinus]